MNNDMQEIITNKYYLNGIELNKGGVINEQFVAENRELITSFCEWAINYPDLFCDLIKSEETSFHFFFYQRIILRAILRYPYVYCTFTRAASKSFLVILGTYLICMFFAGRKQFLVSDVKQQSIRIADSKFQEIFNLFPLLRKEYQSYTCNTNDLVIKFKNSSRYAVIPMNDNARGGRYHGGVMEECAKMDGDMLNEVIIPTMNISRLCVDGSFNTEEPNQQQIYITSSNTKQVFAYSKLIELLVQMVKDPDSTFVFGGDYRIPVMHGLLNKNFIKNLINSDTYDSTSFQREYGSKWVGGSAFSWFDEHKLDSRRKLKTAILHNDKPYMPNSNEFFIFGVDVGRYSDKTQLIVFKVIVGTNFFHKNIVNVIDLKNKNSIDQAISLKRKYFDYLPRAIVIDGNGLGVGLVDAMLKENVDPITKEVFPAFGIINDKHNDNDPNCSDEYKILYIIKANAQMNSDMHTNCYNQVRAGHVTFLIHERDAKAMFASKEKYKKLTPERRNLLIMPYEMTSHLLDEMLNLSIKQTGTGNIEVQRINKRYNKDRFSAFEYGLAYIKELETEHYRIISEVAALTNRTSNSSTYNSRKRTRRAPTYHRRGRK